MGIRKGSHGAGTYSIPGGHLDFGERSLAGAIREVEEETGLILKDAQVLRLCPYLDSLFTKEGKQYITLYFLATEWEGKLELLEPHKCEGSELFG